MKRGQLTHILHLKEGDRFYKVSDRSKLPFEFISQISESKFDVCPVSAIKPDGTYNANLLRSFRGDTKVIFLRNINQQS